MIHVPEVQRELRLPLQRVATTSLADLLALFQLYQTMRRERFTIVHTHTPKPNLFGQIAARLARVPIVLSTVHGFYFHDDMPPLPRRFYVFMETMAARCSDLILSQNSEDVQTAVNEGIAPRELLQLLGNGIDLTRFDRARISAEARRALPKYVIDAFEGYLACGDLARDFVRYHCVQGNFVQDQDTRDATVDGNRSFVCLAPRSTRPA